MVSYGNKKHLSLLISLLSLLAAFRDEISQLR
jgi:hypothetical protein